MMMMADKSWLAFTPDTTPEHARAVFAARYGVQPSEIIRTGGALLAGPVGPAKSRAVPFSCSEYGNISMF